MSKIPISKESFVKTINKLREHDEFLDKLNDLLGITYEKIPHVDNCFIELLDELTNESELVCYYCHNLAFGKEYKEGTIKIDDIPVDMSTPEKLYDVLESEWNKKHKDIQRYNGWEVKLP